MRKIRKLKKIVAGTLAISIIGLSSSAFAWTYQVQPGDAYWKLSERFKVDIHELLKANNADANTYLNVGQKVTIPDGEGYFNYTVKWGDTLWIISQKFGVSIYTLFDINGFNQYSTIYSGQTIKIPIEVEAATLEQPQVPEQLETYITYITHTVEKGETHWSISQKYGIPMNEFIKVNNLDANVYLNIGQKVKIPVYNVPEMDTLGPEYGEYLDWWKGAQYLIPVNSDVKIIDFYSGKSFMVRRTTGSNHADVETLTTNDTNIMKSIWGGSFSWTRRPVIVEYKGRRIAASMSAMPHAGNDKAPGGYQTSWRSGDYGYGYNLDYVKGNGVDGVVDLHFFNSTRHMDNKIDEEHQKNIKIAAGIIK